VSYFLLLGRPPFPERGPEHAWSGNVAFTIPDLGAERDDVPPSFEQSLRRACAFDPGDRFPDAAAFRAAIEAAGFATGERALPQDGGGLLAKLGRLLGGVPARERGAQ
jgi:serine/threonine-protein kinase